MISTFVVACIITAVFSALFGICIYKVVSEGAEYKKRRQEKRTVDLIANVLVTDFHYYTTIEALDKRINDLEKSRVMFQKTGKK